MIKTAKIYKLTDSKNCYVGYTHKELDERLTQHKSKNHYCKSRKLKNPTIHLIELCHYVEIDALQKREQYYIDKYSTMNQLNSKLSHKEIKRFYKYKR